MVKPVSNLFSSILNHCMVFRVPGLLDKFFVKVSRQKYFNCLGKNLYRSSFTLPAKSITHLCYFKTRNIPPGSNPYPGLEAFFATKFSTFFPVLFSSYLLTQILHLQNEKNNYHHRCNAFGY